MNILLVSLLLGSCLGAGPCSGGSRAPVSRPEFRELINENNQLNPLGQAFIQGVNCLAREGNWDRLSRSHTAALRPHHGTSSFLVWHRLFLATAEELMRECTGNPNVVIPYWDSGLDSASPQNSPVWDHLGGNGNPNANIPGITGPSISNGVHFGNCVTSGPFASIRLGNSERILSGVTNQRDCIRRRFMNVQVLSTAQIEGLMDRDFAEFSRAMEDTFHSRVHLFVGGDMSSVRASPGDPIFYLHHANVDRLWALWQSRYPVRASTYAGNTTQQISLDEMPEIPSQTVQDLFSTSDWCYVYSGIESVAGTRTSVSQLPDDGISQTWRERIKDMQRTVLNPEQRSSSVKENYMLSHGIALALIFAILL